MADPLSQLRQYHINKKEIKEHNGYIVFGDHGWPKTVKTNYIIYSSDNSGIKDYYTLECLVYFLKNLDAAHQYYVRQAGSVKVQVVQRPDRKNLLSYLQGEQQTSPSIDKNAPIPSSLRLPVAEIYKRDHYNHSSGDPSMALSSQASTSQSGPNGTCSESALKKPEVERLREAFAARLDESTSKKPATITTTETKKHHNDSADGSGAAITELGAEKLAAMRAKRMAVKRTTIVDADMEASLAGQAGVPADTGSREADLLIAMDSDPFKLIKSKEKVWRTRLSVLQAHSKDFAKTVLPLAQLILKPEEAASSASAQKRGHNQLPPIPDDLQMYHQQQNAQNSMQQQQQQIPRNTYNRYDQERFFKLDIGVEIDTKKSFVSGSSGLPYGGSSTNPTNPAAGVNNNTNQTTPKQNSGQYHPQHHHHHQQAVAPAHGDQRSVAIKRPLKRSISRVPIIIIPATNTSIINMYNAAAILQDLTYVEGMMNRPRESETLIQRRKPDGTHAPYKIMDNPVKLDAEDWNRVVAVFVQGPAWQFKGWPWAGSPVEIFSRIKGFHLKWDEAKLDDNVAKWNVHILELSRNKRHLDKANLLKFWSSLDAYMVKFKSFLKF